MLSHPNFLCMSCTSRPVTSSFAKANIRTFSQFPNIYTLFFVKMLQIFFTFFDFHLKFDVQGSQNMLKKVEMPLAKDKALPEVVSYLDCMVKVVYRAKLI